MNETCRSDIDLCPTDRGWLKKDLIDLGLNDRGWVLHLSDIGLNDLLHFSDIGYSGVNLGPSDRGWMTHC